jgi:hypothetical protein
MWRRHGQWKHRRAIIRQHQITTDKPITPIVFGIGRLAVTVTSPAWGSAKVVVAKLVRWFKAWNTRCTPLDLSLTERFSHVISRCQRDLNAILFNTGVCGLNLNFKGIWPIVIHSEVVVSTTLFILFTRAIVAMRKLDI